LLFLRSFSGRYYARTFGNNKEIWKSLRPEHFSVAKVRLAEFLREQREKQSATANHSSAKMTFGQALAIHLQNQADDDDQTDHAPLLETGVHVPAQKLAGTCGARSAPDSAARKLCIPRITHHDIRHLFATVGIEAAIDIPTVSRWLGHKDGGALAMKTYGHLRREHSVAQALKVSFAPVATKQAEVIPFPATA
jgi:integrase